MAAGSLYLICALAFIRYPRPTTDPWLDPSYEEAYAYFMKTGAQAGVDYAFTYGPLGHFIIARFDPQLYYLDCAVIFVLGLVAAVPLAAWGYRHRSVPAMMALAAVVACLVPGTAGPEIGFLISVVATTLLLMHSPKASAPAYAVSAVFFAFLALTKFTLMVLNSAAVGALMLHLVVRKRYGPMLGLVFAYGVSLAVFWMAAGQHPLHFVPYVLRSLEISGAYNAGMYLPGMTAEVVLGVALWILVAAHLAVLRGTTHANGLAKAIPLLFVLFVVLITWKMGIVRQQGHINKFYVTAATIPFFLPYPAAASWTRAVAFRIAPFLVVVLGSSGFFLAKSISPTDQAVRAINRTIGIVNQTLSLPSRYDARMRRLESYRELYGLPEIRALVGDETVDVFSANQSVPVFNQLNYDPRPVFQGYQACTPDLLRWNGSHYESAAAPRYVLYLPALTPIDNRYPTTEDAETLKNIFRYYRPILFERGMYLLERFGPEDAPKVPPGAQVDAQTGDWVDVPDAGEDWQLLELHLQPTLAGRLRTLVYKMPVIEMAVRFDDRTEQAFRVNIGSIETGFILNPFFGTLMSIDQWPLGDGARRVTAFRISTAADQAWALRASYQYRLANVPPLASPLEAPAGEFGASEN